MWYNRMVQAGLELSVLSVYVWKDGDVFAWFTWAFFDAAFVSYEGQKVSNVTMYHLIYEV